MQIDEHIIKPEDKADILKLDQFSYNAEKNRSKKKTGLHELDKKTGLGRRPRSSQGAAQKLVSFTISFDADEAITKLGQ